MTVSKIYDKIRYTQKGKRGNKVITSNIEHPSVADSFKELEARGFEVVTLNADEKGYINLEELEREVDENTILVSIMYVNNEVGTVQPIEKIAEILKYIPQD